MYFGISFCLVLIFGAVILIGKMRNGKRRRIRLGEANYILTWEIATNQKESLNGIIITNFGFGEEVWALKSSVDDIDLGLRAFKNGVLIVPPPDIRVLDEFCRLRGIKITRKLIKANAGRFHGE